MSAVLNAPRALVLATFNLTAEQVEWVNAEAARRASQRPGSKPNRSEVAREAMEKAMRESTERQPQEIAS